jgi:membrane protein DedA with SNARE-associated domain
LLPAFLLSDSNDLMKALIQHFIAWYLDKLEQGGYWVVGAAMAAESTFVPIPSEVIIPPAAYLAHTKGGMSVAGVVIAGTIGSWIGAAVMYWASRLAGRPLVMKWADYSAALGGRPGFLGHVAKLFLISPAKIEASERWAAKFGAFGVFFSRFLPVVRHLIGIPAGIARIPFGLYSVFTVLGSGLWCAILAWLGIKAGQDEALMQGELHRITLWAVGAFVVLGTIYYFFVHRHMQAERK